MTEPLPEPRPTHTDGQREQTAQEIANQLIAAVNEAMPKAPPRHTGEGSLPVGSPPPVVQPGAPPMSPRETQIGRVALYGGAGLSLPILASSVFMVATEHANPSVIAWSAGGTLSLAAVLVALGHLVKRIGAAVPPPPPEIHNHNEGDVHHNEITVTNQNRWGGKSSTTAWNQEGTT
ncbi:hypothetical protein ABZ819_05230 [Streptomyces venezuelae]|uniref:hypothetical protein n=1 Tax=Streptomyces venezuelae TaxID=54571 RepID=UPI0034233C30